VSQRFSAKLFKVGINPCVDVPKRVSAALARKGYIPVKGKLNGHSFRAGLVSLGGGRHRLYVNGVMRKEAGVNVDDRIDVVLDYDPVPRKVPMPVLLTQALKAEPKAKSAWRMLTSSRRKEILLYLNALKNRQSLQRNVERVVRQLVKK
jgi:hypothetical protein